VVEWLLLDWVDAETRRSSVASQGDGSVPSLADKTKAALTLMQLAFARTEIALNAAIIKAVPPLPAHDARLDHLALENTHSSSSHAVAVSQQPSSPPDLELSRLVNCESKSETSGPHRRAAHILREGPTRQKKTT
jgi:hypothetical protein